MSESELLIPFNEPPSSSPLKSSFKLTFFSILKNKLFIISTITIILFSLLPLENVQKNIFCVFFATILSLFLTNYEISTTVSTALLYLLLSGNLLANDLSVGKFPVFLSGFNKEISWLVLSAFHLGKAVETSGLGKRIALNLVFRLGSSLKGLGCAIFLTEFVLSSFVPSNTARGGGVLMPVIISIKTVFENSNNHAEIGQYLIFCAVHANFLSSSLFLTSTVGNPLIAKLVKEYFNIELTFIKWVTGAIVPAVFAAFILVHVLLYLTTNSFQQTPPSPTMLNSSQMASNELSCLGPISHSEIKLILIFTSALVGWVIGEKNTGLSETAIAFLALFLSIWSNVITWQKVIENASAWNAFYWLSLMIVLSEQLTLSGISQWIGSLATKLVSNMGVHTGNALLSILYFVSMYLFSSITAHTTALLPTFLAACQGIKGKSYVPLFVYFSSLCGSVSYYSSGTSVIYFGISGIGKGRWLFVSVVVVFIYFVVYFTVGVLWWMLLENVLDGLIIK